MKITETLLWGLTALITGVAFYLTYHFDFTAPVLAIIWIMWVGFAGGLIFLTTPGQAVYAFSKEAKVEMQKVVWPTRHETIQTTMIVMIMVAVTGMILWGLDSLMMWGIAKITHLG